MRPARVHGRDMLRDMDFSKETPIFNGKKKHGFPVDPHDFQ